MPIPPQPAVSGTSSAVAAFLRGVERRAAAFAQWQCGDIGAGDHAAAVAMSAFASVAPVTPFADWPRCFWARLLAVPALRAAGRRDATDDGLGVLAGLSGGSRVAVLLRLVAGLPEREAAAVLGVSRATYRLGLQRALPHRNDGSPDPEAWKRIADAAQAAIRALPPDRLARLSGLREAALRGQVPPQWSEPSAPSEGAACAPRRHAPWLWPAQGVLLVALLAALIWTWHEDVPEGGIDDDLSIRIDVLPAAQAPAATFGEEVALLTEPDFELLAAPDDEGWRDDPAFYAWLSAQAGTSPDEARDAHLERAPEAFSDQLETIDADL